MSGFCTNDQLKNENMVEDLIATLVKVKSSAKN